MKDYNNKTFEDIKYIDENGIEFQYARELMLVLQYAKWQNFKKTINKAMIACENSEISAKDCFTDGSKPIISGKGKEESKSSKKSTKQIITSEKSRFGYITVAKVLRGKMSYGPESF